MRFWGFAFVVFVVCMAFAFTGEARGQQRSTAREAVLDAFAGGRTGSGPGGLVAGANGALYGVTTGGGSPSCIGGCGTVYELRPPSGPGDGWTHSVIYAFKNYADGNGPYSTLIMDNAGALYGTTSGTSGGVGTAFRLARPAHAGAPWQKTILYTFASGAYPLSSLTFGPRGELYGTTFYDPVGTVYELDPPSPGMRAWRYKLIHAFARREGTGLEYPLIVDSAGALYGVASFGGAPCTNGCGTVFKLSRVPLSTSAWTLSVLYEFKGPPGDGAGPAGQLLLDRSGSLVGVTAGGGRGLNNYGTVYRLDPPASGRTPWLEHILYDFGGYRAGSRPAAGLIADGSGGFYGTTSGGDYKWFGNGTVFHLTKANPQRTAWNESVLFYFHGDNGLYPNYLLSVGAALYGTTGAGGYRRKPCAPIGCGTVFRLTP